jgi:hypothetical protein
MSRTKKWLSSSCDFDPSRPLKLTLYSRCLGDARRVQNRQYLASIAYSELSASHCEPAISSNWFNSRTPGHPRHGITVAVRTLSGWSDVGFADFSMQHFLYFLPEPHGQGSLRPTLPALSAALRA